MFLKGLTADQITTVGTDKLHDVGTRFYRPDNLITTAAYRGWGGQVWKYVQNNDTATNWAIGNLIMRKTAGTTLTCLQSTTTAQSISDYVGVAQHAIAFGSYGWILVRGTGLYLSGGTTIDHVLIHSAARTGGFDSQALGTAEITAATTSYGIVISAATDTNTGIGHFNRIPL